MMFRLATMPGDPARPNEDFAGVFGNCAILLDGSGAPGDMPTGCIHGVPWYVRQLGVRCLAGMAAGEEGEPLAGILAAAIAAVVALHEGTCDLGVPGTPSSVAVMVRAGTKWLDYLVLGDFALVVEDDGGSVSVVTDKRMDAVAVDEYRAMLALPTGSPEHQAARIAFVRRQQPLRNQPGGYPVASTAPAAAGEALTGGIPIGEARRAALLSDGVTRFAEFGLGTWGELLGILAAGGPGALFARIREAENTDPQGRRWPRAKQHDDVGAVFWEAAYESRPQPVVAAIVTSARGVLIGRRNDGKPPWTFIAGEAEPGERPEHTAIREVKEETGLEIRPGLVIGERIHPKTRRQMIYMAAVPVHGTSIYVGDEAELAEVRWVSLAEAVELLPDMHASVQAHIARELGRRW